MQNIYNETASNRSRCAKFSAESVNNNPIKFNIKFYS